jgi:hypothetical protein
MFYGLVATAGQGTWFCPVFTGLMGVSTVVQSKAREEYRGKQVMTKLMYGLEWLALYKTIYTCAMWPQSIWTVPYICSALYALRTYQNTRQVGIPGRVAYMGVHLAATTGSLCLLMNSPKKLLDLM